MNINEFYKKLFTLSFSKLTELEIKKISENKDEIKRICFHETGHAFTHLILEKFHKGNFSLNFLTCIPSKKSIYGLTYYKDKNPILLREDFFHIFMFFWQEKHVKKLFYKRY